MTASSYLKEFRAIVARKLIVAGIVWLAISSQNCPADEPESAASTNKFPSVAEVIGGQTFENYTEQDTYFLRAIHDRYHSHWSDLLEANITLEDFALSPEKLLQFVNELGEAMRDRDDPSACANLARITGDPSFYANTNVNRPEIIQAAARALIKIGPEGRKALASSITESHYRADPGSLEDIADVIGEVRPAGTEFVAPLAAMAFKFTAPNGGTYPHCTTTAVKNLLFLNDGLSAVRAHLKIEEVSNSPGRFQSVMEGIAAARASDLQTNLVVLQKEVQTQLAGLARLPGGYRDDLQELEAQIERTLAKFQNSGTSKAGN